MIGGPGRSTSENGIYNQYTSGSIPEFIAGDAYINEETGSRSEHHHYTEGPTIFYSGDTYFPGWGLVGGVHSINEYGIYGFLYSSYNYNGECAELRPNIGSQH